MDDAEPLDEEERRRRNSEYVKKHRRKKLSETQDIATGFCNFAQMSYLDLLRKGPENLERREECRYDLLKFCKHYGAETFPMEWSRDHYIAADFIQTAVLRGGKQAFSMPRGTGKSSLCRYAVKWALAYQHTTYACLICATEPSAEKQLKNIKTIIAANRDLLLDFPEIFTAIWHIDGESRRAHGQKFFGENTLLEMRKNAICIPVLDIAEEKVIENLIIDVAGITGEIRGRSFVMSNGKTLRPTLALVDDPQTRESAKSFQQTKDRMATLKGDIGFLGGPGQSCAVVVPCTVIAPDDLADQILTRKDHPEYKGLRVKFLERFPTNTKLWEAYDEIRRDALENEDLTHPETEFYRENREAMDEGAEVSWESRYIEEHGEISALQHAMNCYLSDPNSFFSEYQNDPQAGVDETSSMLSAKQISMKVNNIPRGSVPDDASVLVAAIDVQERLLYWEVMAFDPHFGGSTVDYGTWPELRRTHFRYEDIRQTTIATKYEEYLAENGYSSSAAGGTEGAIYWALNSCTAMLSAPGRYKKQSGGEISIERGVADAGWKTDVVYKWQKESALRGIWWPCQGIGIGAKETPLAERKLAKGERRWLGCIYKQPNKKLGKVLLIDTNFYKSFSHERLATALGERGSVALFGTMEDRRRHVMFAEHLTSEQRVEVEAKGRKIAEWSPPPSKVDNHLFDTHVYCHAAAATLGVTPFGKDAASGSGRRQKVSLDQLRGKK